MYMKHICLCLFAILSCITTKAECDSNLDEPWGQRTCFVADPEGNIIEVSSFIK